MIISHICLNYISTSQFYQPDNQNIRCHHNISHYLTAGNQICNIIVMRKKNIICANFGYLEYFQQTIRSACVRSTMLHGSETWAPKASDLQRLRRNDRAMIRWICGAKLADKIPTAVLHQKLDLDEITAVLRTRRLRYSVPLRASIPSCDWSFQAPEIVGGQGRRGQHVWKMIYLYATWMVSTR